jgi:hypothetical protein
MMESKRNNIVTEIFWVGGVVQRVKHLPSKGKALSLKPSTIKRIKINIKIKKRNFPNM